MPMVTYSHPRLGIMKTSGMATPRKIMKLEAWLKAAAKVFPTAPMKWPQTNLIMTPETICVEYTSIDGDKCAIIINRKPE